MNTIANIGRSDMPKSINPSITERCADISKAASEVLSLARSVSSRITRPMPECAGLISAPHDTNHLQNSLDSTQSDLREAADILNAALSLL
jgi:hypothetical protein